MEILNLIKKGREHLLDIKGRIWIVTSLLLIGLALLITQNKDQTPRDTGTKEFEPSIDTFVPAGFVLVTLQLVNGESVDSMIGDYSQVDLYPVNQDPTDPAQKKAQPLATHLRLIRSPNNPSLFGVLVPEDERSMIQQLAQPVFAVIQNPKSKKNIEQVPTHKGRTRIIKYGDLL